MLWSGRRANLFAIISSQMEVFGSNHELQDKSRREDQAYQSFLSGEMSFKVVQNLEDYSRETLLLLVRAKEIFQVQLPKMPREYILKQAFDRKNSTMCMFVGGGLIGAICFRMFPEERFCEVVFFAIDFKSQTRGNGGFMMGLLKEYFKAWMVRHANGHNETKEVFLVDKSFLQYEPLDFPVYLMTYADNSAIGFFKKQGFTKDTRFAGWVGRMKDYEGGTLMECTVYWEISYVNTFRSIDTVGRSIFGEILKEPTYGPIQDRKIDGRVELGYVASTGRYLGTRKAPEAILSDMLEFLIADISSHASAWPFLQPVSPKEAPDYHKIIKQPMDLSEMHAKLRKDAYRSLRDFEDDFSLMLRNCYYYNGEATQYYKSAQNLELYYGKIMQKYKRKPSLREVFDVDRDRGVEHRC